MNKLLFGLLILLSGFTFAQQQKQTNENNFWDNIRFGGGLGVNFGNNATAISISPTVIYDINPYFSVGTGLGYQYAKIRDVKSNIFSASALVLLNPIQNIQLSSEYEHYFANQKFNNQTYHRNVPALYIGAAYALGRNVSIGIRYDVLYNKNKSLFSSPYTPIFRVFF